jgi:hypothetical protein
MIIWALILVVSMSCSDIARGAQLASSLALFKRQEAEVYVLLEGTVEGLALPTLSASVPDGQDAEQLRVQLNARLVEECTGSLLPHDSDNFLASSAAVKFADHSQVHLHLLSEQDDALAKSLTAEAIEVATLGLGSKRASFRHCSLHRRWYRWTQLRGCFANVVDLTTEQLGQLHGGVDRLSSLDEAQVVTTEAVLLSKSLIRLLNCPSFLDLVEAKLADSANANVVDNVVLPSILTAEVQSIIGFLPLRVVDGDYYVLLQSSGTEEEGSAQKNKAWGTMIQMTAGTPANVGAFLGMAVQAFSETVKVSVPFNGDEPYFMNRRQRLVVLSSAVASKATAEFLLVERLEFGWHREHALTATNLCNWAQCSQSDLQLRWFRLEDLLSELARPRTAKEDSGSCTVEGLSVDEATPNEVLSITIDSGLRDLLLQRLNLETLHLKLLPFRPARTSRHLVRVTWLVGGIAALVGFILPLGVYSIMRKFHHK